MLYSFDEVCGQINSGKLLHVAASENLLRKLPKGNWIGGSTEYFMTENGGIVSSELLFVTEFFVPEFKISSYCADSVSHVTNDAFENGYSIVIIPFESETHKTYAQNAAHFDGMFIKNIVGWISGTNLSKPEQVAISVNGQTGEVSQNDAAVLHLGLPKEKTVQISIINIFEQDEKTPVLEFDEEGFQVTYCRVDGRQVRLEDSVKNGEIDIKLPIVGDYSGAGINISYRSLENGAVNLYAPVFKGIKYRHAKPVANYAEEFSSKLAAIKNSESVFSCNCVLNFLFGELEGKKIDAFFGPITFGEIAYQLVNQTLVYVSVLD